MCQVNWKFSSLEFLKLVLQYLHKYWTYFNWQDALKFTAAQSSAGFICNQQVLSRYCKWSEVPRPLPSWSDGSHYSHWSIWTKAWFPFIHIWSLLDPAFHNTFNDCFKLYTGSLWDWIGMINFWFVEAFLNLAPSPMYQHQKLWLAYFQKHFSWCFQNLYESHVL